ncbi:hypothetical protein [Bacillus swezeyi]|uniref:hypothetical protein n=1 Tax=Bacillus swezeyi TaxID=1925020 RepID=UPI003F88BC4B
MQKMRCAASFITPTIPEAAKAGGISLLKENDIGSNTDIPRTDRQSLGTRKNNQPSSGLLIISAAFFRADMPITKIAPSEENFREIRVTMYGNVHNIISGGIHLGY